MFCYLFKKCIISAAVTNLPGTTPVFYTMSSDIAASPGVEGGLIFYNRSIVTFEVFEVPSDRVFVLQYVSALITRGESIPYPADYLNDYGAVGYKEGDNEYIHTIPFVRSEPNGMLHASQAITINIPANATVLVKSPKIPNQTGGAKVNVSGYYI